MLSGIINANRIDGSKQKGGFDGRIWSADLSAANTGTAEIRRRRHKKFSPENRAEFFMWARKRFCLKTVPFSQDLYRQGGKGVFELEPVVCQGKH